MNDAADRGPTSLEVRIAALEAHMDTARKDVGDVKKGMAHGNAQLATLSERMAHLPGKGFIMAVSMILMAIVTATSAFQREIQQIFHLLGTR